MKIKTGTTAVYNGDPDYYFITDVDGYYYLRDKQTREVVVAPKKQVYFLI